MGKPKASLPFGGRTLLQHQILRVAPLFSEVFIVVKDAPDTALGRSRVLLDSTARKGAIFGLIRTLEEVEDHVFVLAVDLPLMASDVIQAIAQRGLATSSPAVVPQADGLAQPLAAVWRHKALPVAQERTVRDELSLTALAEAVHAEIFQEIEWRRLDPSGNSFVNVNTVEDYLAARERV